MQQTHTHTGASRCTAHIFYMPLNIKLWFALSFKYRFRTSICLYIIAYVANDRSDFIKNSALFFFLFCLSDLLLSPICIFIVQYTSKHSIKHMPSTGINPIPQNLCNVRSISIYFVALFALSLSSFQCSSMFYKFILLLSLLLSLLLLMLGCQMQFCLCAQFKPKKYIFRQHCCWTRTRTPLVQTRKRMDLCAHCNTLTHVYPPNLWSKFIIHYCHCYYFYYIYIFFIKKIASNLSCECFFWHIFLLIFITCRLARAFNL